MNNNILNQELIEELKEYHELEEQLGCPLKVLMQVLKDGEIVIKEPFFHIVKRIQLILSNNELYLRGEFYSPVSIGDYYYRSFKLKDYKKTWWLKGDKQ